MDSFGKLYLIGGLNNIEEECINSSIRNYFLFEWIKNGCIKYSQTNNFKNDVIFFAKDFVTSNKLTIDNLIEEQLLLIKNSFKINNVLSYQKFLFNLFDSSTLFIRYYNIDFKNELTDSEINSIKTKFMKSINNMDKNYNIFFSKLTFEDLATSISDFIFIDKYKTKIERLASINSLTYLDYFNSLNDTVLELTSPLGLYKNEFIEKYTTIFEDNNLSINNYLFIYYNRISQVSSFVNFRKKDISNLINDNFLLDLSSYIIDRLIFSVMSSTENIYNNKLNYLNFRYKEDANIFNEIFFDNVIKENLDDTNIDSVFDILIVENIYRRYNKEFNVEPEHFNMAIRVVKNIYNYNSVTPLISKINIDKLEVLFDEYICYNIWKLWLESEDSEKTTLSSDTNSLVPLSLSIPESLKAELCEIRHEGIMDVKTKSKKNPFTSSIDKDKIIDNINERILKFKKMRLEEKSLLFNNEYKILFYMYMNTYINKFNLTNLNELIIELNSFYDSI